MAVPIARATSSSASRPNPFETRSTSRPSATDAPRAPGLTSSTSQSREIAAFRSELVSFPTGNTADTKLTRVPFLEAFP
jgi:hypothetical protein